MVTVVGLGFVGLTTALGFAEYGHKVYGLEANGARMATIRSGKLPFLEPGLDEALKQHLGKNFLPTTDWETAIAGSECVYYCVGTPYGEDGQADLTYLYGALEQTLNAIRDEKFRVLVTKSTILYHGEENHSFSGRAWREGAGTAGRGQQPGVSTGGPLLGGLHKCGPHCTGDQ